MTDDYLLAEDPLASGAGAEEDFARETRSPGLERWLKILIAVVILALAGELVWLFGVKAMMPFSLVDVTGIPGIDRAMVLAQAGIGSHSTYLTVDPRASEAALEELYQIGAATVVKRYPDRLQIFLEPRRAAAMSLLPVAGRLQPVYFDKRGVIIKIGNSGRDGPALPSLPLVSGLDFEGAHLGMKLHPQFEALFAQLEKLNAASPELMTAVSEIRINWKSYAGYDLVIYPVHYPTRFRLESELSEDTLRYMLLMIDVFALRGAAVDEVDLRTGTASYIKKEASSG